MTQSELDKLVIKFASLDTSVLRELRRNLDLAIMIRRQNGLSIDEDDEPAVEEVRPTLVSRARLLLEEVDLDYDLTLADQALLASLILTDELSQGQFSSRDVNSMIEECGRPRIAHITSAVGALTGREYLLQSHKSLSLSEEGRSKARSLINRASRALEAA